MHEAILRHKDAAGLAEWRSREWRDFPTPPRIADVDASVEAALRRLAAQGGNLYSGTATELWLLAKRGAEPVVMLEPDVVFWGDEETQYAPIRGEVGCAQEELPVRLWHAVRATEANFAIWGAM